MFRRQVGAIERITHFEAESVACPKPARPNAKLLTFCEDIVPNFPCVGSREENFHSILPGVSSARDVQSNAVIIKILDLISCRQFRLLPKHGPQLLDSAGP